MLPPNRSVRQASAQFFLALVLLTTCVSGALAQAPRVGRPRLYARGGIGVLGQSVLSSARGTTRLDLSTTGTLGVSFPLVPTFALGVELRGLVVRGDPRYGSYLGDLSIAPRWRIVLADGAIELHVGAVLGPTAAMLWIVLSEDPTGIGGVGGYRLLGVHGGWSAGFVCRISENFSLGVHFGHVHHVLFSPPSEPLPDRQPAGGLHLDQLFLQTELSIEL